VRRRRLHKREDSDNDDADADADDEDASNIIASRPPASSPLQGAEADELAAAALERSSVPARRMVF
jgi:hypothetical protein